MRRPGRLNFDGGKSYATGDALDRRDRLLAGANRYDRKRSAAVHTWSGRTTHSVITRRIDLGFVSVPVCAGQPWNGKARLTLVNKARQRWPGHSPNNAAATLLRPA